MEIVKRRASGIHYTLSAELRANGDLVLEGHDLSSWLEKMGRDEYEYFYTVRANDVPRVSELLGANGDGDLLHRVRDLLAPEEISASKAWRTWLESHGIPFVFAVR